MQTKHKAMLLVAWTIIVACLVLALSRAAFAKTETRTQTVKKIVVQKVDGKSVHWWAARARANGLHMRQARARVREMSDRLRIKIEPLEARYEHAAILAAVVYHVDAQTLIRKGRCESANWTAFTNRNSGAMGPWQFLGSTWRSTPMGAFDPYDPEAAALGAAWMHANGRGGEWSCQ